MSLIFFIGLAVFVIIMIITVSIIARKNAKKHYKEMALKELKRACNVLMSCNFFDTRISSMRNYLNRGGLCLEDIRSGGQKVTEQRIKKLKTANRKAYSKLKLKILRETTPKAFADNPDFFSNYLKEIIRYIDEVGLSLKEIGSSEEEFEKFHIKIIKAKVQSAFRDIIKILEENTISFADIGIKLREEDVASLLKEVSPQPQN